MDSHRTKGPVCGIENCRSKLYDEGEDGFLYCQNGHRQGGLVRGEDDEDNYTTPASRVITRKKKDTSEDTSKVTKLYSGRRALGLFLKCIQLILRHQLWFLVHEKGLPAELEIVVFDLWALRIAQLEDKIASGNQEIDPQSQVYSTLDSGDSDATGDEAELSSAPKNCGRKLSETPSLYDCIGLCYLGALTLRLPITLGDFFSWTIDGKIAFRGAIKFVPLTMRDHLPPTYHNALDPQSTLSHNRIYDTLTKLQLSFEKDHGILWPALNVPLLLFRYLKELALPLELYDFTLRLSEIIGLDFAFHCEGKHRMGLRYIPEAQLVGCLLFCIKLFYPLDKIKRVPSSVSEPGAIVMDWKVWRLQMPKARKLQREDSSHLSTKEMLHLSNNDAFNLLPEQLDQYLDFYADNFLDDAEIQRTKDTDDFRNALYGMFPIEGKKDHQTVLQSQTLSHAEQLQAVVEVHKNMSIRTVDDDDESELPRPGQLYPLWKKEEDLPKRARAVYEEVGRIAGLSLDMVVRAVYQIEAMVERQRRDRSGRSKGEGRETRQTQ